MKRLFVMFVVLIPFCVFGQEKGIKIIGSDRLIFTDNAYREDNLYCPTEPKIPDSTIYIAIIAELKATNENFSYPSLPPQYPARWVYKAIVIDKLEDIKDMRGILCVLKIEKVINVEEKYKHKKRTITEKVFDGYKILEERKR